MAVCWHQSVQWTETGRGLGWKRAGLDFAGPTSYSRPGVSDDNAFIESWFRTLKYVPSYPSRGFADIEQARQWCHRFVSWYNDEHRHREIGYVTPNQRHNDQSAQVLEQRRQVYEAARQRHPERWSQGVRRWKEPAEVSLNKREKDRSAA